jgi:hypothetical protein
MESEDLEPYKGFDEKRMVSYEAIAVDDLYLDGVDVPLKVARIIERNPQPPVCSVQVP